MRREVLLALPPLEEVHPAGLERIGAQHVVDAAGLGPRLAHARLPARDELVAPLGLDLEGACDDQHGLNLAHAAASRAHSVTVVLR